MPSSLWPAPRTKSRTKVTTPFHSNGLTIRSVSIPWIPVFTSLAALGATPLVPKLTPFAFRLTLTTVLVRTAVARAVETCVASVWVISSEALLGAEPHQGGRLPFDEVGKVAE